jgi:molybdate transport system substrate-binding protein
VPAEIHPPIIYAASVTRLARRPNPQDLIAFLATPEATALLTEGGLETNA